jgi:hypothetical protein
MRELQRPEIAKFFGPYPEIKSPIEDLWEVADAYGIPARIHVGVRRMDELLLHYSGNPTSPLARIIGSGKTDGLCGTEEVRLYAHSPEWVNRDRNCEYYAWEHGKESKVGNVLLLIEKDRSGGENHRVRPQVMSYIILEVCNRWYKRVESLPGQ